MKNNIVKRTLSLLLALVCVMGVLPLSAFAAEGQSDAPAYVTQQSADYWRTNGRLVRYQSASSQINSAGRAHVFDAQVSVPGLSGTTRALCSHHIGTLGSQANGQKWNYKQTVDNASLKVLLTYVYSHTNGNFTDAGNARGLETWGEFWSDLWYITAQTMTWYWEYGLIKDVTTDREGFIEQASEEMITSFKVIHDVWNFSPWIKDWDSITIHSIIDSNDGGKTGNSAYDYIKTGVDLVLDHPEYYYNYNLWEFEWDKSQPWKLTGQSGVPMQRLLIAVPEPGTRQDTISLTVKKLEAGSNKPLSGVTFSVKSADGSGDFSVTRQTGADGTLTLTDADGLSAGQYTITEEAVPEGYVAQTSSQTVTVMPNDSISNTFTFYNEPVSSDAPGSGTGSIRKIDADNPTVGIPGAVIRITSVKLDDGGSFFGEYTTGEGGYVLKEDLDFSKLPTGSYIAEEITPPQGYILSSDVSKVKQPFVWDGEHDVSLIFENSSKVKVVLKKVDESGSPLAGAVFLVLRDGQIIATEETQADGTITVPNVTEGHYEFVEVSAPAGFDCDKSPVGVHVNAEDLQGEQTITVTKVNHHKRTLTVQKRDAESGDPIPGTSFHVRGINIGYTILQSSETVFLADSGEQSVVTVRFENAPDGSLLIRKVCATNPSITLQNAEFKVAYSDGTLIGDSNGIFRSDENGEVRISGLKPDKTVIVTEVTAPPGFIKDTQSQSIQIKAGKTVILTFKNQPKGKLIIQKRDSATNKPLSGAEFRVTTAAGCEVGLDGVIGTSSLTSNGIFTTDSQGEIRISNLAPGAYVISEIKAPDGYVMDTPSTNVVIGQGGDTQTVVVKNSKAGSLVILKQSSLDGKPLEGVEMKVTTATGEFVPDASGRISSNGLYYTNKDGKITINGVVGTLMVTETRSIPGYSIDPNTKTQTVVREHAALLPDPQQQPAGFDAAG